MSIAIGGTVNPDFVYPLGPEFQSVQAYFVLGPWNVRVFGYNFPPLSTDITGINYNLGKNVQV